MTDQKIVSRSQVVANVDDSYKELLIAMKDRFNSCLNDSDRHLYKTNMTNLFEMFLNNLPAEIRQHYNCNMCRRFVNRYGGLVTLAPDGDIVPAVWPMYGDFGAFNTAVRLIYSEIEHKAKVTSVFFAKNGLLGEPMTGEWCHMAVIMPTKFRLKNSYYQDNAGRSMAESANSYKSVINALVEYKEDVIKTADTLIASGALFRSEQIRDKCSKFLQLRREYDAATDSKRKRNLVWYYVANHPAYTHIKSSMLGTLLDDIKDGIAQKAVINRFNEKVDPMKYMRPQAAPTTGNIQRAEQLFKELGLTADCLKRRFATMDDLEEIIWKPAVKESEPSAVGGIFDSLLPHAKGANSSTKLDSPIDRGCMTWARFNKEILPHALNITASSFYSMHFATFVTAKTPTDLGILKWGNNVSYYLYTGNVPHNYPFFSPRCDSAKVTAICYDPALWGKDKDIKTPHTYGINFILEGARDFTKGGRLTKNSGIFPEDLRPELHEVRSTIARYSAQDTISGFGEDNVAGFRFQYGIDYGKTFNLIVETDTMGTLSVCLDRWE